MIHFSQFNRSYGANRYLFIKYYNETGDGVSRYSEHIRALDERTKSYYSFNLRLIK